jgi:hypothetical protein
MRDLLSLSRSSTRRNNKPKALGGGKQSRRIREAPLDSLIVFRVQGFEMNKTLPPTPAVVAVYKSPDSDTPFRDNAGYTV